MGRSEGTLIDGILPEGGEDGNEEEEEEGVIAVDVGNVVPVGQPPPLEEYPEYIPEDETDDPEPVSTARHEAASSPAAGGRAGRGQPRSQRQIDREMKEEAERIRREDQAKEEAELQSDSSQEKVTVQRGRPKKVTAAEKGKKAGAALMAAALATVESSPSGRPKRERKLPSHMRDENFEVGLIESGQSQSGMGESEKEKKEGDEESDRDSDAGSNFESEGGPERLWCVCQQPHNNRFMICCDSCLDWYHGKCVGITKKMGKEMEEAGNEWTCPKCKGEPMIPITATDGEEPAHDKMEDESSGTPVMSLAAAVGSETATSATGAVKSAKKSSPATPGKKKGPSPGSRRKRNAVQAELKEEKRPKERMCYECEAKPPLVQQDSIYCSDECIVKHVIKARAYLNRNRPKSASAMVRTSKVMDMAPILKTMLTAAASNAPTEDNPDVWIKSHPSFL